MSFELSYSKDLKFMVRIFRKQINVEAYWRTSDSLWTTRSLIKWLLPRSLYLSYNTWNNFSQPWEFFSTGPWVWTSMGTCKAIHNNPFDKWPPQIQTNFKSFTFVLSCNGPELSEIEFSHRQLGMKLSLCFQDFGRRCWNVFWWVFLKPSRLGPVWPLHTLSLQRWSGLSERVG